MRDLLKKYPYMKKHFDENPIGKYVNISFEEIVTASDKIIKEMYPNTKIKKTIIRNN